MFRVLDRTLDSPQENLSLDESLLHEGCETLRFWESPAHFIALGRSSRLETDVRIAACTDANVPVVRRTSGGGAVLQGPGCLNYALILSLTLRPELESVEQSYSQILAEIASALDVPGLEVYGSDVLLSDRKISGNAQRRTRGWMLHHGTILYDFELELMERFLHEPVKQPPHRRGRRHTEFLANLPMSPAEMKHRIASAWSALENR